LANRIGFIQGRLSPIYDGRIQLFPHDHWKKEFELADKIGIKLMEWTIDTKSFEVNPILQTNGTKEITSYMDEYSISIPSVTCDYFMENPFWKEDVSKVQRNIETILYGMAMIKSQILVIPLVDNASPSIRLSEVIKFFKYFEKHLKNYQIRIAFELDFPPAKVLRFITNFPPNYYGINYDIGNSAALDFDPSEEMHVYSQHIINVHIKDRKLNGGTVPLGQGNANFDVILSFLKNINYEGNYILQTARDPLGRHVDTIVRYKEFVEGYLK